TKQVGQSGGSEPRYSATEANKRVLSPTDRSSRATEARNSGSSSTIATEEFGSGAASAVVLGTPGRCLSALTSWAAVPQCESRSKSSARTRARLVSQGPTNLNQGLWP